MSEFQSQERLDHYRDAANALRELFAEHDEPVLHGLVDSLLTDNESATVLLGMRNQAQAAAASDLGEALTKEQRAAVRALFGS